MNESFASRLTKARMVRALSQTELGKAAHIAPTQISRYETGRATPRAYVLGKIAAVLNVSAEWLATGLGQMERFPMAPSGKGGAFGFALSKEETDFLLAAAAKRGVSFDEFVTMAFREATQATESVMYRGEPPTLEAVQAEIGQQRVRLEELAKMLKRMDMDRKPKP